MSGGADRSVRLGRILDVQNRKRRLEEWRLADLKREAGVLAASSEEIVRSLGEECVLNGLFLEAKASALKRNEGRIVRNLAAQTTVELAVREAQAIEKRLERAASQAGGDEARLREREGLADALDDYFAARAASLE